jgi:hypothetical protein
MYVLCTIDVCVVVRLEPEEKRFLVSATYGKTKCRSFTNRDFVYSSPPVINWRVAEIVQDLAAHVCCPPGLFVNPCAHLQSSDRECIKNP